MNNDALKKMYRRPAVQAMLAAIEQDHPAAVQDQKELVVIPAPPFGETERAKRVQAKLAELGLKPEMDQEGNVLVTFAGTADQAQGQGRKHLVLAAHLDTVFPLETPLNLREDENGILHAPGIGDDTRGLAALLSLARVWAKHPPQFEDDVTLVANVGEEGRGDLRGVKALFRDHPEITAFVSIDGFGEGKIVYQAAGSKRYEVEYRGPGGHSFGAFGTPSAVHALGRAIAQVADFEVPKEPKTTFSVSVVSGGTSINAIAEQALMQVDLRSSDSQALKQLETQFLRVCNEAAEQENARWGRPAAIKVETRLVGDRPTGQQERDSPFVELAAQIFRLLGTEPEYEDAVSTDANWPISLGIPALTLPIGGRSGDAHALTEWFDPKDAFKAVQAVALLAVAYAGGQA